MRGGKRATRPADIFGSGHFRNKNSVWSGTGDGRDIAGYPGRVETVDTHNHLARSIGMNPDRRRYGGTGVLLGFRQNRVLKVEDERVGGNLPALV